jgi:hypothetical protein
VIDDPTIFETGLRVEREARSVGRRSFLGLAGAGVAALAGADVFFDASSASAVSVPFPLANPWTEYYIGRNFAGHHAVGSVNPGIDFWMDAGTSLQAPHAGALASTYNPSTNLAVAQITHSSGWKSQLLHLSQLSMPNRNVTINAIVGESGGVVGSWGAGTAEGEHVHWALCPPGLSFSAANNVDPLLYINTGAGAVPDEYPEDYDMTDIVYYTVSGTYNSGGISVVTGSMWYQECPGAPLFPLSNNTHYYNNVAMATEYEAWSAHKAEVGAKRHATTAANIGALIALRGQATQPIGNFA